MGVIFLPYPPRHDNYGVWLTYPCAGCGGLKSASPLDHHDRCVDSSEKLEGLLGRAGQEIGEEA